MVQPQYNPQEALERIKLMMKYDTSKTLNENKETINEVVAIPWLIGLTPLIGTWIYNIQGGGDSFSKTKSFFEGCSKNIKELKPTVSKSEYRAAADSIYNAIEGLGTDEDAIKAALNSMPTVADLCALNSWYSTQYGDLYDDLDGDIDGTDFIKYVWSAIAPKIADAQDDLNQTNKKEEISKPEEDCKTNPNQEKCKSKTPFKWNENCKIYKIGCKSDVIAKVQACLGLVDDGKFGKKTSAKLKELGYNSFTDADVDKICNKQTPTETTPEVGGEATPEVGGESTTNNSSANTDF
jgi:hypothetical protein